MKLVLVSVHWTSLAGKSSQLMTQCWCWRLRREVWVKSDQPVLYILFWCSTAALMVDLTLISVSSFHRFTRPITRAAVFHPTRRHLWVLLHLWQPQQALAQQARWWLLPAPRLEGQVEHQSLDDFNLIHTSCALSYQLQKYTRLNLLCKEVFPGKASDRHMSDCVGIRPWPGIAKLMKRLSWICL